MRKQNKTSLTRKLDKETSRVVRSKGICQWCDASTYELLQCCHIFSRTFRNTRWDFNNLLCLCASCHFRAHREPVEFTEFVKQVLGESNYVMLRHNHNAIKRWSVNEMQELLETLNKL